MRDSEAIYPEFQRPRVTFLPFPQKMDHPYLGLSASLHVEVGPPQLIFSLGNRY